MTCSSPSRAVALAPFAPAERVLRERDLHGLRTLLGEAALAALMAEGQTLSLAAMAR
jgi:hypothetical protein